MRSTCAILVFLAGMLGAACCWSAEPVDLELVLSVDSSGSIDDGEFALQRLGYARAITHPDVLKAIRSGPAKAIALTFIEWSGPGIDEQIVGWTRIASESDALAVAALIQDAPRTIFSGGTAIGAAILRGLALFEISPWKVRRRILDLSGDGPNNRGVFPEEARDLAVSGGITINALAVDDPDGWLARYFRESVIGGKGAFTLSARDFRDFERAIVRKLIREIFVSDRGYPSGGPGNPFPPPQTSIPRRL